MRPPPCRIRAVRTLRFVLSRCRPVCGTTARTSSLVVRQSSSPVQAAALSPPPFFPTSKMIIGVARQTVDGGVAGTPTRNKSQLHPVRKQVCPAPSSARTRPAPATADRPSVATTKSKANKKKLRAPAPRPRAYASLRRAARHTASQRKHSPRHVVTRARPPLQQLQQRRAPRVCASVNWTDLSRTPPAPPCCTTSRLATAANTCCVRRAPCSCCPACARPVDVLSYLASAFRARCASLFQRFPATRGAPRRVARGPLCLGSSNFERGKSGRRAQREDRGGAVVVVVALRRKAGAWAGGRKARRKRERRAAAAFFRMSSRVRCPRCSFTRGKEKGGGAR